VLIACILFTWFENLQGNFDISLSHLKSGINILESWRANSNLRVHQPAASATLINDDLAPMLDHLKAQAKVFLRSPDQPNPLIHASSLPEKFLNIAEARRYFYQIIHWTYHSVQDQGYVRTELIPHILRKLDQCAVLLEQYIHEYSGKAKAETAIDRYWRIKSALHLRTNSKVQ
jgi:hypothetical protein